MALPKEIIDAVKADKEMLAKKFDELKATLTEVLKPKEVAEDSNKDIVDAINSIAPSISAADSDRAPSPIETDRQSTAFDSIVAQGEMAQKQLDINRIIADLEENLLSATESLSSEDVTRVEEQIALLKSDKMQSISNEDQKSILEKAEQTNNALYKIGDAQVPTSKTMSAFDSIVAQGEMAEVDLQIKAEVKELEKNLNATSKSTSKEQKEAIEEQIALLKGDKLQTIEDKREALKIAKEGNAALKGIEEGQSSLAKSFKEGFDSMRGEGILGLVKMLLMGIPALLAGVAAGISTSLVTGLIEPLNRFLEGFESLKFIFGKTGSNLNRLIRKTRILFSRKGYIGKFFGFFVKRLSGVGKALTALSKSGGTIGNFVKSILNYASMAFNIGKGLAKFVPVIAIAISIITGLIGGIKGAMKGFKEDGIIGMLREGIIGVFNALIGGLVKMVGSMIGGIFKLLGFKKIGEGIKSGFADFVDGFVQFFRGAFNVIAGLFTLDMDRIKKGIGQALDGIVKFVFGAIKGIGGIIVGLLAGIVKGVIGAVKLALKAIFAYLKFVYITLPIALIKFIGEALKFIFWDLPMIAFGLILKAVKFMYITLPTMLIKGIFKVLKSILWDLPIAAFGMVFDAVKFMFVGLPMMLIDKVKSFFTSMVESIGAAFTGALDFVKLIGKASWAALKAAMPGGESPKEAFLRVMGGAKDKEEEEKENAAVIKDKVDAKAVEPVEAIMPPSQPKKKETTEEFEARMMSSVSGKAPEDKMEKFNKIKEKWKDPLGFKAQTEKIKALKAKRSEGEEGAPAAEGEEGSGGIGDKIKAIGTMMLGIVMLPFTMLQKIQSTIIDVVKAVIDGVMGLVGTILGFIGKLGKAGIAAVKAIMPGGDSPAEAFMKVLSGDGEPKEEKIQGEEVKGESVDPMGKQLASAKSELFVNNMLATASRRDNQTLTNFGNNEEEFVGAVDQIEGEGIIRDNQYEEVRRNSEGQLLDAGEQFISPEDLEYVDSVKGAADFSFEGDDRVKQILDSGMKKKYGISNEDYTFDKRKDLVQEGLGKKEDDFREAARGERIKIQEIEDGTYTTQPESLKAEPKVEKKTDFMSMIFSRMKETASKAFGFTPKGSMLKAPEDKIEKSKKFNKKLKNFGSKFFGNKSEEAGDLAVPTEPISRMSIKELMAKAREKKEESRVAARKFNEKRFGKDDRPTWMERRAAEMLAPIKPVTPTGGAEIAAGQNQVLDAKAEQAGTANVISTDQSVRNSTNNNSSSSVTIAAPAHIDKTPVVFGAPFRAW